MRRGPARILAAALAAAAAACRPGGPAADRVSTAADTSIVSRSIVFFETRLAADSNNYLVAGRLATRYLTRFGLAADLGDLARAEALARRLAVLSPDRAAALSRLSGVLLAGHQFAGALAAAREAVAADPGDEDARGAVFDAALAGGRYQEAEDALAAMRPGSLGTLVRRAYWLDQTGQVRGARESMDRVCRRLEESAAPPATVAWCLTELAGLVHQESGERGAEAILRRAVRVQPGYRGAIESLADLALVRGEWETAYPLYRRIAAAAHPDLYLRLGEVAAKLGRSAEREAWHRRFVEATTKPDREALFGAELALFLLERNAPGDRDSALAIARREIVRRPTGQSHDLLAWVHLRRGEAEPALVASDRAMALGSPSPGHQYHRGRILEALGRGGEAKALLRAAEEQRSLLPPHARLDAEHRSAKVRG